eukprot:NODE_15938_length_1021_cov_2.602908.p1 GENE.NODE_15938_length_1021_cov_2.602908~~NODE_15938_length_1021_cov_2.602908.p1  ORF type:complete len:206 (+),score=66.60 NODE_15938_length_1021_cov_2.602908:170-787(+)
MRYTESHPVWRALPNDGAPVIVERLSAFSRLMRRYAIVQKAQGAKTIGLLIGTTSVGHGRAVADRLEAMAVRAGRRVYRFVVGQLTPEKLGNFPGIELFVSLASPEHFPFDAREFYVPIASPFELEVALGAREWSPGYIVDLDELLSSLPAAVPCVQEAAAVPALRLRGAGFGAGDGGASAAPTPPAPVTAGLDGVAGNYTEMVL